MRNSTNGEEEQKMELSRYNKVSTPPDTHYKKALIEATGLSLEDLAEVYLEGLQIVRDIAGNDKISAKDRLSAAKRLMDIPRDMPDGHGNEKGHTTNQTIIVQGSVFDELKEELSSVDNSSN